jgi:hypothetical protein
MRGTDPPFVYQLCTGTRRQLCILDGLSLTAYQLWTEVTVPDGGFYLVDPIEKVA